MRHQPNYTNCIINYSVFNQSLLHIDFTKSGCCATSFHAASIQDSVGARAVLLRLSSQFTSIVKIFADGWLYW